MKNVLLAGVVACIFALAPLGCSTHPGSESAKATLSSEGRDAISRFRSVDSTLEHQLATAAGFAILPDVGKGAVIVGATFGRGEVYEGGSKVGYCALSEGMAGLSLGVQRFSELIIFQDRKALDEFKAGEYAFAASTSFVAFRPGVARVANYRDGVAVFVHVKSGLMLEVAIGGQRIRFEPT